MAATQNIGNSDPCMGPVQKCDGLIRIPTFPPPVFCDNRCVCQHVIWSRLIVDRLY